MRKIGSEGKNNIAFYKNEVWMIMNGFQMVIASL